MPVRERNFAKIKQLLDMVTEGITKDEFINAFQNVVNSVKKVNAKVDGALDQLNAAIQDLQEKIASEISLSNSDLEASIQKELNNIKNQQVQKMIQIDTRIATIQDGKDGKDGEDGKSGQNADEEAIRQKITDWVTSNLALFGTNYRDALELLQGSQRLRINAIDNLREELDSLKKDMSTRGRFGGAIGPSVIQKFLHNVTPLGTINGVTTAFTLPKAPITNGERVYLNGVRMRSGSSNDYTVAGKTITFSTAPVTDSIILVDLQHN